MQSSSLVAEMRELSSHAFNAFAIHASTDDSKIRELSFHACAAVPLDHASALADPRTFPATPSMTYPTRRAPDPPAREPRIVELGIAEELLR
jgi:hypothetical protein